jgi:hypothetical protein
VVMSAEQEQEEGYRVWDHISRYRV